MTKRLRLTAFFVLVLAVAAVFAGVVVDALVAALFFAFWSGVFAALTAVFAYGWPGMGE